MFPKPLAQQWARTVLWSPLESPGFHRDEFSPQIPFHRSAIGPLSAFSGYLKKKLNLPRNQNLQNRGSDVKEVAINFTVFLLILYEVL